MEVDKGSPAYDAGLRVDDLVTHINNEPVQGLNHIQVSFSDSVPKYPFKSILFSSSVAVRTSRHKDFHPVGE